MSELIPPEKKPPRIRRGNIEERKLKNGRRAYYARYIDVDGKRKNKATKQLNMKEAKIWLATVEARIRNGQVGIVEKTEEEQARATITFKELAEAFQEKYSTPKLKDPARYMKDTASTLKMRILPFIGSEAVSKLKLSDMERLRDALSMGGYAGGSQRRVFALISKIVNWGRKTGRIDCANATTGLDLPTASSSLDFLSKQEVADLLAHTEEHFPSLYPMVATAIYTGLRKGELWGLRWTDVHLENARIDVNRSYELAPKSGKARHVPMHPELVRILKGWKERWPKNKANLLFTVKGEMGSRWDMEGLPEILKAAGCHATAKAWHCLRHTFASHFMMAGGNILTLQKLLGHASLTMTMIYAHLSPDHLAAEVARMSFVIPVAGISDMGEERRKRIANGHPEDTEADAAI